MASSKLIASSPSRNSDLKRKLSACSSPSDIDFLRLDSPITDRLSTNRCSDQSSTSTAVRKTVDDVWKEIVEGKKKRPKEEMMTLEDFLAKVETNNGGAVVEVKEERFYGYDDDDRKHGAMGGKRSLSLLEPMDKAAQQRQRRMIKNRESAARSRERKQAYQVELESMAVRLEEENEHLIRESAEQTKKRLKQLMENVIPIVEKRKPARVRRVRSMQW